MSNNIELSVVIPCLNEADTLGTCIEKALKAFASEKISGEVIVADNGSVDGSQDIAKRLGARVVNVPQKGYGAALMGGIAEAKSEFILMGDADDSYDFLELGKFFTRLKEGFDLVQGCRFPAGGGKIMPGAMPFLHRWWGNPMFSYFAKKWFGAPVTDIYCGMRAFKKSFYQQLDQRCTGMEFATEMIIKASLRKSKICEVPITLHQDGRIAHPPHLKTFRDGWRTLHFFLLFSPRQLFLVPGVILIALGFIAYALALPGMSIAGLIFDAHTLLFGTLGILCGYQLLLFAFFSKTFAVGEHLMPASKKYLQYANLFSFQKGLFFGLAGILCGAVLLITAILQWRDVNFKTLDYAHTMRIVIPGATLLYLGVQTIFASFFVSLLSMKKK